MRGSAGDAIAILRAHGSQHDSGCACSWTPTIRRCRSTTFAYTVRMAARVKAAGAKLLLDFHYSDTWADPGHQTTPAAWAALGLRLAGAAGRDLHRRASSPRLKEAGALPDIVQVGNEIDAGILWPLGQLGGAVTTRSTSGITSPACSRPASAGVRECARRPATPFASCCTIRRAATPAAPGGSSTT